MSRKDKDKSQVESDVDSEGSEQEYVVEKIINRRLKHGKVRQDSPVYTIFKHNLKRQYTVR